MKGLSFEYRNPRDLLYSRRLDVGNLLRSVLCSGVRISGPENGDLGSRWRIVSPGHNEQWTCLGVKAHHQFWATNSRLGLHNAP